MDIEKDQGVCLPFYNKLQDCLIATDRDWSKCQEEVKKWKQCFVEKQKNKQQQQP